MNFRLQKTNHERKEFNSVALQQLPHLLYLFAGAKYKEFGAWNYPCFR